MILTRTRRTLRRVRTSAERSKSPWTYKISIPVEAGDLIVARHGENPTFEFRFTDDGFEFVKVDDTPPETPGWLA